MNSIVYRKIFVPSMVVLASLFAGGCLSALAEEFEAEGGGDNDLPRGEVLLAQADGPQLAMKGPGGGDMCPPPGPGGPGGPGMFPPPCGPGGHGMFPPPPPGPGGPGGPMMMLPLGELDLSDAQVEKIADLRAAAMDKAGPSMAKMHSLERQFRTALTQSEINRAEVTKVQTQLFAEKQAVDEIFTESLVASAQVLTAEQRQQLRQKINRDELGPAHFRKASSAK